MSTAISVEQRAHGGRRLHVYESAPAVDRLWRFLCIVLDERRLEVMLTVTDDQVLGGSLMLGDALSGDFRTYVVEKRPFAGDGLALANFACSLLDLNYHFPDELKVSGPFVWSKP